MPRQTHVPSEQSVCVCALGTAPICDTAFPVQDDWFSPSAATAEDLIPFYNCGSELRPPAAAVSDALCLDFLLVRVTGKGKIQWLNLQQTPFTYTFFGVCSLQGKFSMSCSGSHSFKLLLAPLKQLRFLWLRRAVQLRISLSKHRCFILLT